MLKFYQQNERTNKQTIPRKIAERKKLLHSQISIWQMNSKTNPISFFFHLSFVRSFVRFYIKVYFVVNCRVNTLKADLNPLVGWFIHCHLNCTHTLSHMLVPCIRSAFVFIVVAQIPARTCNCSVYVWTFFTVVVTIYFFVKFAIHKKKLTGYQFKHQFRSIALRPLL